MGPVVDMSKLPRLFYMHPIIIWSVCVLFYLAIEQSRQVIISEGFPGCYWLPPRHVIIFTPAKKLYCGSMRHQSRDTKAHKRD